MQSHLRTELKTVYMCSNRTYKRWDSWWNTHIMSVHICVNHLITTYWYGLRCRPHCRNSRSVCLYVSSVPVVECLWCFVLGGCVRSWRFVSFYVCNCLCRMSLLLRICCVFSFVLWECWVLFVWVCSIFRCSMFSVFLPRLFLWCSVFSPRLFLWCFVLSPRLFLWCSVLLPRLILWCSVLLPRLFCGVLCFSRFLRF